MLPKIEFKHDGIVVDACIFINLDSSGQMGPILRSLPCKVAVPKYVSENEILKFNPQPYFDEGLLTIASINLELEEEANLLLEFGIKLVGVGESHTGVIAEIRKWAIATDDVRALKILQRETPHLQLLTTPDLVKYWADVASPQRETVREALGLIKNIGRYTISPQHACYEWWKSFFDD